MNYQNGAWGLMIKFVLRVGIFGFILYLIYKFIKFLILV